MKPDDMELITFKSNSDSFTVNVDGSDYIQAGQYVIEIWMEYGPYEVKFKNSGILTDKETITLNVIPDQKMLEELMIEDIEQEVQEEEKLIEEEVEEIIDHELGHATHEDDVSKAQKKAGQISISSWNGYQKLLEKQH